MKAGFGKEDITPRLGVELCGYGYDLKRRAESVQDNLCASCIAFESNKIFLIINCDLIGFDDKILSEIKNKIKAKYGIGEECVMVTATHTHTGPAVKHYIGCGEVDEVYINELPQKIFIAAEKAISDLKEIDYIQSSQKQIEPIGYNRSIPNGPEDHYVRGFIIKRSNSPDIAVASYNCHPVAMGISRAISRDYPGQATDALSKNGVNGIFITGICGDIDPVQRGSEEIIKQHGEKIAEGFFNGINDEKQYPESFSSAIIKTNVPVQMFNAEKIRQTAFDKINGRENPGYRRVVKEWEKTILDILESESIEYIEHEEGTAHIFAVGDIIIAGINYEAFTEIGEMIRGAFPDKTIIVAGNVGAIRGYFPSKEAIVSDNAYKYEAVDSSFLYRKIPVAEEAAEVFADNVISGIKEMEI